MVEQLAGYFADFGEPVVLGTTTATAIVDMPAIETLDALARDLLVTLPAADAVGLAQGDACTIRAVSYTVRAVVPEGSGLVSVFVS